MAVAATAVQVGRSPERDPTPEPDRTGEPGPAAAADPWRPTLHLAPDDEWMNDVQRPFWADGEWHLYNLVNTDHPTGEGTSWRHATSTDLVHWRWRGIAIEKFRDGLGDVETGSVIVDERDTAGFGAGTLVALVTQQLDGVQRQSLFYSRDGGDTFTAYAGNPVLDNPGTTDFRDPKVVWDDERDRWVMALAEGHKIGFYTSPDLLHWTYSSGFERDDLGTLECPDLFPMTLDGDPARVRWVLAASANGAAYGRGTGYAYWVGSWDGRGFAADDPAPQWLDQGADFNAAVTWADGRRDAAAQLEERYAVAWMNSWAYARALPVAGAFDTLVRTISLRTVAGRATLTSRLAADLPASGAPERRTDVAVAAPTEILRTDETSYRLTLRLGVDRAEEVRVRVRAADGTTLTVGYDAARGVAFLARDGDAVADGLPEAYRQVQHAPTRPAADGTVTLDLVMDGAATELLLGDGVTTFTSLAFLGAGPRTVTVEPVGGTTTVEEATLTPLGPAS